jgi:hypothetical protein
MVRKSRQMQADRTTAGGFGSSVTDLAFASLNTLEGQISTETLVLNRTLGPPSWQTSAG